MLALVSIKAALPQMPADDPEISRVQQAVRKGPKQDVSEVDCAVLRGQKGTPWFVTSMSRSL
jgi:hypothetical protein